MEENNDAIEQNESSYSFTVPSVFDINVNHTYMHHTRILEWCIIIGLMMAGFGIYTLYSIERERQLTIRSLVNTAVAECFKSNKDINCPEMGVLILNRMGIDNGKPSK